jgi:hypothetical protein
MTHELIPLLLIHSYEFVVLDQLRRDLDRSGHGSEVRPVPYEFIRGGAEMLVVDGSTSPDA